MRIGLTGGAPTIDRMIEQARDAEAGGFTSLWYASVVGGDPLVPIAIAGRATERIELGTAVLQTYPCHPLLQANRAASVTVGMARPGFTLGIGPSHEPIVRGMYGLDYDTPGRNTAEYIDILTAALRGDDVDVDGDEWSAHGAGRITPPVHPVPVLLSALGPRLLRVAGEVADGVITWLAPTRAIGEHVAPHLHAAAEAADRPPPRLVAGLPVAVHDDITEARATADAVSAQSTSMAAYQRILDLGGAASAGEAAIVGNEASVSRQLQSLLDAGATDIWAAVFAVGENRRASVQRTTELLRSLVG